MLSDVFVFSDCIPVKNDNIRISARGSGRLNEQTFVPERLRGVSSAASGRFVDLDKRETVKRNNS